MVPTGYTWLYTQESLLEYLGSHKGCWGLNPGLVLVLAVLSPQLNVSKTQKGEGMQGKDETEGIYWGQTQFQFTSSYFSYSSSVLAES